MILGHATYDGPSGHEAGRALLAELYIRQTGEPLPPIQKDPWGKPYFPGSPWHFSISHTRGHVFCVLARENVGLDAERLGRRVSPRLAERVLSAGELAQYAAAADRERALLTFWVLKEAEAKREGRGLRGFPNHTDFSLDDPRVREIDGCIVAIVGENHAV